MTKREFVVLAWDCQNCDTENPGPEKSCTQCGAPQPDDVQFHEPTEGFKKVTDPKKIEEAASEPDVHCGFCGTRNAAKNKNCTQCGADMKEGQARKVGNRLDTPEDEGVRPQPKSASPSKSKSAGAVVPIVSSLSQPQVRRSVSRQSNVLSNLDWARLLKQAGIALFALIFVSAISWFVYMKWFNVTEVPVTIDSFAWKTEVPIGEIFTYHEEGWTIPVGGRQTGSESRHTGSYEQKQVCELQPKQVQTGTQQCNPHVVDRGNGYGEVVYDQCPVYTTVQENVCHNENDYTKPINATWYFYDIDRWTQTRTVSAPLTGLASGNEPYWPEFILGVGESEGLRSVRFVVYYTDELGEPHTFTSYSQSDWSWFTSLSEGQVCYADRNGFGDLNEGIDCRSE